MEPVFLPAGARAVFVVEGSLTLETWDSNTLQPARTGWVGQDAVTYLAGAQGARVLRWELVSPEMTHDGRLRSAPKGTSTVKLAADVDLDPSFGWLLRCDQVSFPAGTEAPLHVHQGPGIRCVLSGEMDHLGPEGEKNLYRAGDPFFELGIDAPIWAGMSATEETTFVRGLLLPRAVKGRGSTRFVKPSDWTASVRQTYTVFAERFISLPASAGQAS
jgi:quercetin dioxygenase-like cupin family protein